MIIMRRHSLLLSLTGLALLCAPLARAQDPSKIIDQYVKAAGGSKNLAKVRTLLIDGAVQSGGDEKSGTFSFRVKLPNRYYTELRSGGKTEIEAYNGKSAWHQGDSGQIATLLGQPALEIRNGRRVLQLAVSGPFEEENRSRVQRNRFGARPRNVPN